MKINDITYNIPTGWNEVSVKVFEQILELAEKQELFETTTEFGLRVTSVITGIPYAELLKLTAEKFTVLQNKLEWTSEPVVPTNKMEYLIEGKKYLAIPNFKHLTFGEMIDAETIIKDTPQSNIFSKLAPILIRKAVTKDRKLVPSEFDAINYPANVKLLEENLMITEVVHLKDFF